MKRRALMFLCSMAISTAARGQTCSVQTVTPSIVMMPCYGCSDFAWFIVPEGVTWEVLSAASMVTVPRGIDSGVPYLLVRDGASNSQNPGGDAIARSLMANTLEPGSTYSLTWTAGVAKSYVPGVLMDAPLPQGLVLTAGQQIQMGMTNSGPWRFYGSKLQVRVCR